MNSQELIDQTIETLKELEEDINMPKNIKGRIQNIIGILKEDTEPSIKINKSLNELDEISDDPNLQPDVRAQIWNIVSILENINH